MASVLQSILVIIASAKESQSHTTRVPLTYTGYSIPQTGMRTSGKRLFRLIDKELRDALFNLLINKLERYKYKSDIQTKVP